MILQQTGGSLGPKIVPPVNVEGIASRLGSPCFESSALKGTAFLKAERWD